ncbi:hypothetical protein GCM10008170_20860 [Methylopila capsulata]|uniref:Uncharacterized protein n=1 Tax=Methylopila capsulata TaxID=61654 RepID=A0A9W6MS99_9HYPH|nr:hypothetical protein GCM10008170_20860 [Methylopila capsulata]
MNNATICGWEKRTIVKAKKPTSARATASIAAMRPAPKERKNPTNPFTAVSRRAAAGRSRATRQDLPAVW